MLRKTFVLISWFFILSSCATDETSPDENESIIQDVLVEFNIESNVVVSSDEIAVTVKGEIPISKLEVFLDENLLQNFTASPYTFTINTTDFEDGSHDLNVHVYSSDEKVGFKSISIKIDNTGPMLALNDIANNEIICDNILLSPNITDVVSKVERLQVYFDDLLVLDRQSSVDFDFTLFPEELPSGMANLKFVMEDEIGNISRDSIDISIAKKLFNINFPNDFMRKNIEKIHIVLSDADGNYIDSKTHFSGEMETLSFCSLEEISNNTEFSLIFVHDFDDSIFNFYVYNNLTLNMLGNEITLNQTSGGLSPAFPKLDVPFYETGYQMRASGPWLSMIYSNEKFSGHVSTQFSNGLATNKTFISYFNANIENSYQWALITDIQNRTALQQDDFSMNNVVTHSFDLDKRFQRPLIKITGYENEAMYRARSGHLLYGDYLSGGASFTKEYSFADIFEYTTFWGQLSNYTFEGSGIIPAKITVPNETVDYNFFNKQLSFTGLGNYEVGRLRLVGIASGTGSITSENPSIRMEFIFDGQNTNPTIPEIPEGLFPEAVTETFANKAFEIKQGAAENYSAFGTYEEYIKNVLVPSVPFYIASPFKERVFKSEGPQWLPAGEFPF